MTWLDQEPFQTPAHPFCGIWLNGRLTLQMIVWTRPVSKDAAGATYSCSQWFGICQSDGHMMIILLEEDSDFSSTSQ